MKISKVNWKQIHPGLKDLSFIFLSSFLIILSFPKTEYWFLCWGALIPLYFVLDGKSKIKCFWVGMAVGFLSFLGLLYWLQYVTLAGMIVLVFYLSLYFGVFGLSYCFVQPYPLMLRMFLLSSIWAALEFIRAHLFSGFDWGSLGYSQYQVLPVVQLADVTGVYGISFLIILVNSTLKEWFTPSIRYSYKELIQVSLVAFFLLSLALGYGVYCLQFKVFASNGKAKIAVVQGNVNQELKWYEPSWPYLMKKHLGLTRQVAEENPAVIIWPETSFPGFLWEDAASFKKIQETMAEIKTALIVGSVLQEQGQYFNSAVYLNDQGLVDTIYRKIRLVPFGEFIPFRKTLPFLSALAPIGDFTPGDELTLFSVMKGDGTKGYFSVLICFEDAVSSLSREFVRAGAQFLVNITNDAWFWDTKAPFMHLQSSVLRSVENRRAVIRAANTGVSAFIDRYGRVYQTVKDESGRLTYVSGAAFADVELGKGLSFYTRFGDVFVYGCFVFIAGTILRRSRFISFNKIS
jgi:apolipoprotein N-acyltransferase